MRHSQHHRRHILALAALLFPLPALATTYNLSSQTINLATSNYTAADTLNCSYTTFTSTLSGFTLPATLSLSSISTALVVNTNADLTFSGPLTGSGYFTKSGYGNLTLSAPTSSFIGYVGISGGALRLTDPDALGPASAPPLTFTGNLDVSGTLPSRSLYSSSNAPGVTLINNTSTPVTLGPSFSFSPAFGLTVTGSGDITYATPFPTLYTNLSKVGAGTLTYSTPTHVDNGNTIGVAGGTLRLGIESPFSGNINFLLYTGGTLDLNGFSSPGVPIIFNGGAISNNNTSATSTLSTTPLTYSTLTLGGAGNINLSAKAVSLIKTGTGTLSLSASNPSFAGTLTINDGTLRLNNPAATGTSSTQFILNSTAVYHGNDVTYTAAGTLDLNGYPAPAGNYSFSPSTFLINNNTSTPSTVSASAVFSTTPLFGGNGEIIYNRPLSGATTKIGPGILTLNYSGSQSVTVNNYQGLLRLGNPSSNAYSASSFNIYGPTSQILDRYTALDLNGRSSTPAAVTLYYNSGIVNNNTSITATLDNSTNISYSTGGGYVTPPFHVILGGDGVLNVTTSSDALRNRTLDKVGAGLLTLPSSFSTLALNLRAGTLQAESNSQLGSSISFLGGTLLISPLYLPPQSSYTFTPSLSVDPSTGGTLNTQRNSLFTGSLTGSGPFTKTGSASATLNLSPSSRLSLTLAAGTLHLSSTSTPTLTSLTLTAGSLDVASAGLILYYTGTSPLPSLLPFLASHQLYSSTADADPNHLTTLAYLDTGSSLIFSPALLGDANLDGKINADDYALLDRGFALHSSTWSQGDFNYDGTIDQSDYLLIDRSLYQAQGFSPGFLSERESQFGNAYIQQLLTSLPEPSPLLTAAFCLLTPLLSRRRQLNLA